MARFPLAFVGFWLTRNFLLGRSIDRIYYPLEPIFQKYRRLEKEGAFEEKDNAEEI